MPVIRGNGDSPWDRSRAESFRSANFGFGGFFFAIPRRRIRFQRTKKSGRHAGYFVDGGHERTFVRLRRFVEAADFPHELKGGGANLIVGDGRIEIEKGFDIPAHSL
ncbi:MAG TPA: hypothetical protein VE243_01845 [Candidatus Acidoferrum sp.]|nr:hypothetical protein [Candidatus Acidoferrum sp.]